VGVNDFITLKLLLEALQHCLEEENTVAQQIEGCVI
jgi:ferritin